MRRLLLVMLVLTTVVPASAGPFRNAYLSGTMPWRRTFRDVNLCTGNLMKSFTDIQSAPGHGAGLVLQRTYNSNDDSEGGFGHGWSHAYDIRMEEASQVASAIPWTDSNGNPINQNTAVVRTDFFGGKHVYTRDADGLYSPPPYLHDWMQSSYDGVLANGPGAVNSDIDTGLDGTIKHYTLDVPIGNIRMCDYIQDRNGNRTNLTYDTTTGLLSTVTDPAGRTLTFQWAQAGASATPQQPWRIMQVTGPSCDGTNPRIVVYRYDSNGNLSAVHLDAANVYPSGVFDVTSYLGSPPPVARDGALDRATTYGYTNVTDGNGNWEYNVLASITTPTNTDDPAGSTVSYDYQVNGTAMWVQDIYEPAGEDPTTHQERAPVQWTVTWGEDGSIIVYKPVDPNQEAVVAVEADSFGRATMVFGSVGGSATGLTYDGQNNVTSKQQAFLNVVGWYLNDSKTDCYYYGASGNALYHWVTGFSNASSSPGSFNLDTAWGVDRYTYHDEDYYFQKASYTDVAGNTTTYGYGDINGAAGDRGNLLWVRDANHQDVNNTPAYTYQYYQQTDSNATGLCLCGQKESETNYNGVATQYNYGDQWGNLTQVVQDAGTGNLNRTTTMQYTPAGQVINRVDPMGYESTVGYNSLGQPVTASFPVTPVAPGQSVGYAYQTGGRLGSVTQASTAGQSISDVLTYEKGCDRVKTATETATGPMAYDRVSSYTYTPMGQVATKTLPGVGTWTYTYADDIGLGGDYDHYCMPLDDPNEVQPVLVCETDSGGQTICGAAYYDDGSPARRIVRYAVCAWRNLTNSEPTSYCQTAYTKENAYLGSPMGPYNSRGYLTEVQNTYNWWDGSTWQSKVLSQNNYTCDSNPTQPNSIGNRITNTITDQNGNQRTETYGYDALSRLTSVSYGDGGSGSYTYDAMGNRISDLPAGTQDYWYNSANMLTSFGVSGTS